MYGRSWGLMAIAGVGGVLAAGVSGALAIDLGTCGLYPSSPLASNGPLNDAANGVFVADGYGEEGGCDMPVGVQRVYLGGFVEQVHPDTLPEELRVEITAPDGQKAVVQPFDDGTSFNFGFLFGSADNYAQFANPVNVTGAWTFRFFETVDHGGTAEVDATWGSVDVVFTDDESGPPSTFVDLGTLMPGAAGSPNLVSASSEYLPAGEPLWFKLDVPTAIDPAMGFFLDMDTDGTSVFYEEGAREQLRLVIFDNNGSLLRANDQYTGEPTFFSYGAGARLWNGNKMEGNGQVLPAGTYWIAVAAREASARSGFSVGIPTFVTPADGLVDLQVRAGTHVPASPPVAQALGTLTECGVSLDNVAVPTDGSVNWYSFTLPEIVDDFFGTYLDIDNEGSEMVSNDPFDPEPEVDATVMGLYNSSGFLIASAADGGQWRLAQLSFGAGTRPGAGETINQDLLGGLLLPILPYSYTASYDYDGRHGGLGSGTYYLAVVAANEFDPQAVFAGTDFVATPALDYTGTFNLNIRTNVGAVACCEPWIVQKTVEPLEYLREAIYYRQGGGFGFFSYGDSPYNIGGLEEPVVFFSEVASLASGVTYQWYKDGQPLGDEVDHISGVTTPQLVINPALVEDSGVYQLHATSSCGSATGPQRQLTVVPEPCRADANRDGMVNFFDLLDYLNYWFSQDTQRGDVNLDGVVNFFDLLDFLDVWFSGC